jgi:two-component system nitrate/nitrite response regulator NarL
MQSKTEEGDKLLRIPASEGKEFAVVVVGRDPLTTSLVAGELERNLPCEALVVRPPDLLNQLKSSAVDLVIISADLNSARGAGCKLAREVYRAHPGIPILLLLDEPTRDEVVEAFHCGARGVFNREEPLTQFLQCVELVRKGCLWARKEEADWLLEAFQRVPVPTALTEKDAPSLTMRELEVVKCAARGGTNRDIACELRLSEHTVKNYLFRAFEKLGVSSRVELLFYLAMRGHALGQSAPEPELPIAPE